MYTDKLPTFKGHQIDIYECGDDDCSKAMHEVMLPDGTRVTADITPSDWRVRTVELWIEAGYPDRKTIDSIGPLRRDDLERLLS